MSANDLFPPHYKDFIHALNKCQVEYLLIGGYAMGAYGHIRGTEDLDIFINATTSNAEKLIEACSIYGIDQAELQPEMFLIPKIIGIGDPPLRIEILKHLGKIDFEFAFQRKLVKEVDSVLINVVNLEDLILLKQEAIKERDKARDAEDLSFLQKLKERLRFK